MEKRMGVYGSGKICKKRDGNKEMRERKENGT